MINSINKALERFEEKFGFYEIYVCSDCGHSKGEHYWNGGGRIEASGYDRCRNGDCECISEKWKIRRVVEQNNELKAFLTQELTTAVQEERERIFELAKGLKLEPDNLEKQIIDFESLLDELAKPKGDCEHMQIIEDGADAIVFEGICQKCEERVTY